VREVILSCLGAIRRLGRGLCRLLDIPIYRSLCDAYDPSATAESLARQDAGPAHIVDCAGGDGQHGGNLLDGQVVSWTFDLSSVDAVRLLTSKHTSTVATTEQGRKSRFHIMVTHCLPPFEWLND